MFIVVLNIVDCSDLNIAANLIISYRSSGFFLSINFFNIIFDDLGCNSQEWSMIQILTLNSYG